MITVQDPGVCVAGRWRVYQRTDSKYIVVDLELMVRHVVPATVVICYSLSQAIAKAIGLERSRIMGITQEELDKLRKEVDAIVISGEYHGKSINGNELAIVNTVIDLIDTVDQYNRVLKCIEEWTCKFGSALIPRGPDTFGEGMREAKRQVANLVVVTLLKSVNRRL